MTQDTPGFAGWNIAFKNMKVGAANRRLRYPNDGIRRMGYFGLGAVLQFFL
jgi:hypothetical protein